MSSEPNRDFSRAGLSVITGPGGSILIPNLLPGSVVFGGAGGALAQDQAKFFWDASAATLDVNGTVRISTGLTLSSTATGFAIYATADQTTDYERLLTSWDGGNFSLIVQKGGSGIFRPLRMAVSNTAWIVSEASLVGLVAASAAENPILLEGVGLNASSGHQYFTTLAPIINQSGSAGYTGLLVSVTESATGSGAKRLLELMVGASTKLVVDSAGNLGLGVTPTSARLHVNETTLGNEVLRLTSVATNDDPNFYVVQARVATTGTTPTLLREFILAADTAYLFEARVLARRTGGTAGVDGDSAGYIASAVFKRAGTGSTTLVGPVTKQHEGEDQAAWDATFTATGSNTVDLTVTGEADNNITWHSTIIVQNLSS